MINLVSSLNPKESFSMTKILSRFLILAILLASFSFINVQPAQAAASLYLSPGGATVAQGSSFSVSVRTNTGGAKVNAVQANLSYPADKLDFLGIGTGGTAFEITAEGSGEGGTIKIGRGTVSGKSGDLLIATVSFRAKTNSGSATVSFTGGSAVVRVSDNKNIASGKSGGTYAFSKPAPKPKPDKKAPKITDVKVKNLTKTSATVTWKTNESATSVVEWGPTKKYGITSSSSKLVKSHSVKLDKRLLTPGADYFYRVKSKDKAGNVAVSKSKSFRVPGFTVQIKVTDEEGNPVEGAVVTLVSVGEVSTDENGVATFEDVSAGEQAVLIEYDGKKTSQIINVEAKDKPQTFEGKIEGVVTKKGELSTYEWVALIMLIIVLIAGIATFIFRKRLQTYKLFAKNPADDT